MPEGVVRRPARRVPHVWSALALYAGLTIVLAYPLSVHPASTVLADDPDTHLFMWTLAWDAHALAHQPFSIFDANIFYPERRTLAYSENLLGAGLFVAPVLWITDNPVLAMNLVALLSCVLCGFGAYVLGHRVGLGTAGALLCGLIFAFSPARFFRMSQIHLTTVQWIPFALAALHMYFEGEDKKGLRLAAAFVTLQAMTTGHGAMFVAVAVSLYIAWRVTVRGPVVLTKLIQDLGLGGALLLIPVIVIFIPYFIVQNEMGLRRALFDWAPTPQSFVASPTHVHAWLLAHVAPHVNETASAFLFPGYIPLLLIVIGVWWSPRSAASRVWRYAAATANVAAIVALGIALMVTFNGPLRFRSGSTVLLSARSAARAWIVLALLVGVRIAIARWVPVAWPNRLRAWLSALLASQRPRNAKSYYAVLTVVCVLLAAPPPFGIWPLVYWIPGFNFIRGPSRFMILGVLGIAVLAAFGFERIVSSGLPRRRTLAAAAIGVLMLVEFAAVPLRVVRYTLTIPAADRWLDRQPKPFVVVELPVFPSERYQTMYMLHSLAHWQKTVHGYSGMRPRLHDELYTAMRGFPDAESLTSLARLGVTYVMVHADLYPPGQWADVERRINAFDSSLTLHYVSGAARVYRVRYAAAVGQ